MMMRVKFLLLGQFWRAFGLQKMLSILEKCVILNVAHRGRKEGSGIAEIVKNQP